MTTETDASKKSPDWVDNLAAWGCGILHLTKYQKILTQLAKFVITGVIATVIDWLIYAMLIYWVDMEPLIAQLFSFIAATIFNFYSNTIWVFNTTKNKTRKRLITEFFIISFMALILSEILLGLFIKILPVSPEESPSANEMIAKIITTAIIMIFNFTTRKLFLEERKKKNAD